MTGAASVGCRSALAKTAVTAIELRATKCLTDTSSPGADEQAENTGGEQGQRGGLGNHVRRDVEHQCLPAEAAAQAVFI